VIQALVQRRVYVCGIARQFGASEDHKSSATPTRPVVADDAVATANNILAHEQLFRWGFGADLFAGLCVMPLIYYFVSGAVG